MATHTPGPWIVRDDAREWAIIGAEPSWVTAVDKRNHNAAANAALIAAAPDLLVAAEALIAAWDQFDENGPASLDALIEQLRAGVAKATAA